MWHSWRLPGPGSQWFSGKLDLVRVAMLGPLRLIAEDGSPIDLGGARLRMLLARLALEPGQVVSTESLIDGLWGAAPPSDATNALQSLVSRLRRSLRGDNGSASVLESHPAGYRLSVAREDVDVYRFEQLTARGREELKDGQPAAAAATLRAALELWRGPAMVDLADAPFAATAATRLLELHAAAVEDRIEADIQLGRHREVLAELRTLVAEQPLRERRSALLIKALYLSGRQADALAAYDSARRTLADELGVEPSDELREVHVAVLRRDPALAPAAEAAPARGSRLPARLTSFVGRASELREVRDRLADTRLVTLVGPGGAGKTRLSTEIAAMLAGDGLTGWFVELAGIGESADVAGAVLTALGLREVRMLESSTGHRPAGTVDPMERLVETLASQRSLIVLDNCEHVIAAAADVADTLLASCPGLRILATSREPLAITGEVVFPVGPLELPAVTEAPEVIGATDAARLFVDRARSAHSGFVIDEHNAATVAEICQRLDGLPLALELAAARLRSMTVQQIADRLDDRFRLLTAGSRTSMPRHRTLRAVVEWSWDLLEKTERVLARRLSIFAAGATVDSATAVCADPVEAGPHRVVGSDAGLAAEDVLYVLASLVEKSLVEASQGADGAPRYRMLETVRAYAAEKLAEAGESAGVHAAFDRYFLELAEEADPHLRGHDQVGWLARLTAEQDNIQAAVRHAADAGDADTGIRLSIAAGWFYALSGRQREALNLAVRVADLPGPAPDHARAAMKLFAAMSKPGMPEKKAMLQMRADLAASDAMKYYPVLAMVEPLMAIFTGDLAGAEEAGERARNHADPWARATARLGQAFLAENEGRAEEAEREAVAALGEYRRLGDRWGQAMALGQISESRSLRGDHAGAVAAYEESIALVSQLGTIDDLPELFARMASQRVRAGDLDGAERDIQVGLAASRDRANPESEALLLCGLADLTRRRGDLDAATEHLDHAVSLLVDVARPEGHWRALYESVRARIALGRGRSEEARPGLARGYVAMLDIPDLPVIAGLTETAAAMLMQEGDPEAAAELVGLATGLRGTPDLGNTELDQLVASIRASIGDETYAAAHERAAALGREDALAKLRAVLAVDESEKDSGPPSS
jgi:predicted ATPase/DNA-binding SARP family transcriptional activator